MIVYDAYVFIYHDYMTNECVCLNFDFDYYV